MLSYVFNSIQESKKRVKLVKLYKSPEATGATIAPLQTLVNTTVIMTKSPVRMQPSIGAQTVGARTHRPVGPGCGIAKHYLGVPLGYMLSARTFPQGLWINQESGFASLMLG